MKKIIAGGKSPGLCHVPSFIGKIKAVSQFEPSQNGGGKENA
ncbi:hypothetical protein ASZ90_006484 [hydrocarbon metagenome]|uniref:Uncharacterized protein n=1 Tax=hydrocarbon metagenome TaxID=938273 RepID=A0A0W8FSG2_9ZZZZ